MNFRFGGGRALFGERCEQPREDLLRLKAALRRERDATGSRRIAIGISICRQCGRAAIGGGTATKQRGPRGLRVDERARRHRGMTIDGRVRRCGSARSAAP